MFGITVFGLISIVSAALATDTLAQQYATGNWTGTTVVNLPMEYVTEVLHVSHAKHTATFVASTCGNFNGLDLVISLQLKNNREWVVDNGVVYFTVTNSVKKGNLITAGDVLCSNTSPGKTPKPTCVVKKYKASKNPLLLVVRAGNVDDVSLSARMAFTESAAALGYNDENSHMSGEPLPAWFKPIDPWGKPLIYLREVINYTPITDMYLANNIILETNFCPNDLTGPDYSITISVVGQTPMSTFTTYACKKLPCDIDSGNVFMSNPMQLPFNKMTIKAKNSDLSTIYVLIRAWGGEKSGSKFLNKFSFNAYLTPGTRTTPKPPVLKVQSHDGEVMEGNDMDLETDKSYKWKSLKNMIQSVNAMEMEDATRKNKISLLQKLFK